jgi:hypothetical protein
MGTRGLLRGAVVGLFICAGLIGLMETDAFAVAGKTVTAMAGPALAGATLELELTDGTSITAQVDQQGNVELPDDVNRDTVRNCYRKEQTATGETKQRIDCAGWLPVGGVAVATAAASGNGTTHQSSLLHRFLDTEAIFLFGQSWMSGINSTSTGASPGNPPFLQGSGSSDASEFSYNFMLRHHFDRFMPMLGGGRPFMYFQGSSYHGFDGTGGVGVSGSGLDQTALNRQIKYAVGGGIGYSHPVYCPNGSRGGNNCFEFGLFVGANVIRQQLSATADEAGNTTSFQNSFSQVVPSGGAMVTTPGIWKGLRLIATYEVMALNSAALSGGPSFFGNQYNYQTDGGLIHNLWFGLSFNLGSIFCDPL